MRKLWMIRFVFPSGNIMYAGKAPGYDCFALTDDRLKAFGWLKKEEAEDYLVELQRIDPNPEKTLSNALEVVEEIFYENSPQFH